MKNIKKSLKLSIICMFILICLAILLFLFMKSPVFKVSFIKDEVHLELGSTMEKSPSYYLEGEDWCVPLSYVDTSSVNHKKIGRYPVYIYHGFEKYTCYVTVTDTTAPEISCDVKTKTIQPGESISIKKLGIQVTDYSEIESLAFTKISSNKFYTGLSDEKSQDIRQAYQKGIDVFGEEFQFSYGGIYTLTIEACDTFHNRSQITLTLKVEQPPVIEAPSIYAAIGTEIDFSKYITAWDLIDESFSVEDVEIESSELNIGTAGDYPITITGTDSYGLTSTTTSTVHVLSKGDLQELINTHKINFNDHIILGAYNKYDSGYYENKDLAFIQETVLPSIVHIENDKLDTFGSGFIIEINDEFVTIATNEHVVSQDMTTDVSFYDGTTLNGAVVFTNAENDIAFIRIPIDGKDTSTSASTGLVSKLRTVHIDESYWKGLGTKPNLPICYTCIDYDGNVWNQTSGKIVEKLATRNWNQYEDISESIISTTPVSGSSGSALFDSSGRLVGMIRGYTDYESYSETVAVPLNEILRFYELAFKYKIQYQ